MQYPDSPNGIFMIDPTGPVDDAVLPFEVFCDMSSDMGKTILNQTHHQEGGMFHVSYDNNLTQVVAVIDRSVHCRQLLKLKCNGNYTGSRQMSWKSRSNEVMYNWANPTGSRGCPCGLQEGCYQIDKLCNCDIGEDVITSGDDTLTDVGYITDKATLPVVQMNIESYHDSGDEVTLGPIECNGAASELQGPRNSGSDTTVGWELLQ
ncbi:contactin-associated protein-like 5 [Amphiura filiformis]|uniref:contactin-associated protein-like 5 n=1 Tax=Amphiura filiformis TaxID=82378 RepID=UPI003B22491A